MLPRGRTDRRPKPSFFAFRRLVDALNATTADRLELTDALSRFASTVGLTSASKARLSPTSLERTRERICAEVTDSPSVSELAGDAGISREHPIRAFTSHFGMPPHEYRMHIRARSEPRVTAT